jgi:hypothetical protein
MDQIVNEAIQIQLHAENFKWEAGFILSPTGQPSGNHVTETLSTTKNRQPRPSAMTS